MFQVRSKTGITESRFGFAESTAEVGPEVDSGDVPATSETQLRPATRLAHSDPRKPETHEESLPNRF